MPQPVSTADYRKYPKGPNFLLIVILASIFILVAILGIWIFLGHDVRTLLPHRSNPHPNARLVQHFVIPTIETA